MRMFCTPIILSLAVILVSLSPSVYAADEIIYKCTLSNGAVQFQDFACTKGVNSETISFSNNINAEQAAANSLREHEVKALDRMHAHQMRANDVKYKEPIVQTKPETNTQNNNSSNAVVHIYQTANKTTMQQTGFIVRNK